jgi:curved DNA-binding protein
MEFKDYYQTLGVPRTANADEVKRAYRKLARRFHPDVSKEARAEERFKEVQEAYEVLKDPEKRAAYDQLGSGHREGQSFRPPPDWGRRYQPHDDLGADPRFSEFFSSLFGAGGPFAREPAGGARQRFHSRGEDAHAQIDVSLAEAYAGTTRTLELQQPELNDGQVAVKSRTLKVTVPAGVTDGQLIRLAGQGSSLGDSPGDLYLQVRVLPNAQFTLDGRNVTLPLAVAPWEAALGATVPVPTLGGPVDLKIPAGSQSGQRLRLRGRGLPGDPAGDQYVLLRVVLPPATTPRARELYEAMARDLAFNPRPGQGGS